MDKAVMNSIKIGTGVAGYIGILLLIGKFISSDVAIGILAMSVFGVWAGIMSWFWQTKLRHD